MKIAVMQPYIFPYLGYFKLVSGVSRFVFLDDVNFIKKGWINRNRLLISGEVKYFTVPLSGASQNALICEVPVLNDRVWRRKFEASVVQSYSKAFYFEQVYSLLSSVLFGGHDMIGEMAKDSVLKVADYLSLPVEFVLSSGIYRNQTLKAEKRILDICRKEESSVYLNLDGGRDLYCAASFAASGVELAFVDSRLPAYPQFSLSFEPGLSIIDVLMHNSPSQVLEMLK
jgi:hypothetical protein